MAIPKVIHYCWFGKGEMPDKEKSCVETWKEILPDYIRAAFYLGEAIEETGNWSLILESLGRAARTWKPLGKLAKHAIHFVGEAQKQEEEEQRKKALEAKDQLQQMAEQVLHQVEQMMSRGEYAQALGIIGQLRQMLPEDQKIQELERQLEETNAGKQY